MKSGGILESTLETEPAKAEGARAALDQALREFAARGLTADELEAALAEVKTQFLCGVTREKTPGPPPWARWKCCAWARPSSMPSPPSSAASLSKKSTPISKTF